MNATTMISMLMLLSAAAIPVWAAPPGIHGTPGRRAGRPTTPLPDFGYGDPDGPHGGTWDYATPVPQDSTPGRFQFFSYDYNGDGVPDIVLIKRNGTGTGTTELHVLDGATDFSTYLQQTGTGYGMCDANTEFAMADWDFDGIPDLFVIIKQATGSGTTEVHVLSGASGYQDFIVHSTSALGLTTDQWTFKVADWDLDGYPDLIGVAKYATGTNSTEVHILSGISSFQNFILHTGTPLGVTDANWDFSIGQYEGTGYPDLEAISKAGYGTNSTEVHVLGGASSFTAFAVEDGTSLYMHVNDPSVQSFYLPQHGAAPTPRIAQVRFWGNDPDWRMHLLVSAEPIWYRGGYGVMGGVDSLYYIYYGNVPAATRTALENFARGIGNTNYYGVDVQYNSGGTYIANSVAYGGATAPGYTHGTALNDALIRTIVNEALNAGALPRNSHGVYLVVTAPDVTENDACTNHYCGFHTFTSNAFVDIKYGWIGDPHGCAQTLCTLPPALAPSANNDLYLDAMVSITAHEFSESVTDPHVNTWYDFHGNENADKCAWRFGPMSVNAAGRNYNLRLATGDFVVQQNWHLSNFGYCTMRP